MSAVYYVQLQARRILSCIYPDPYGEEPVCPAYLRGLEKEDFWSACERLRELFTAYYRQAESAPASLELPIYEMESYRSTSAEAREGNAALLRFPSALFAMGKCGELSGDALCVNVGELRKFYTELRCKYLQKQFSILSDFGFAFDFGGAKSLPKSGTILVYYPDDPRLLTVLSAMGDKLEKHLRVYLKQPNSGLGLQLLEQFVFVVPGIFADTTEILAKKSLNHMISVVGERYREVLCAIVEKFQSRGLTLRFDTAFLKNRFYDQKGRDSLCFLEYGDYKTMWEDGNEQLFLRLKLNHPDAYMERIKALPPHLFRMFTDVWCANCAEKCNRRIVYRLEGEEKRACGCFFFAAKNPSLDDLVPLLELFDLEQAARAK